MPKPETVIQEARTATSNKDAAELLTYWCRNRHRRCHPRQLLSTLWLARPT